MIDNLILVRHGESEANANRILAGRLPYPLTKSGRKQARHLAQMLKYVKISEIYSSPVKRAYDTAAAVGKLKGIKVKINEAFTETDVGAHQGEPLPLPAKKWKMNNPGYGEQFSDLQKRTIPAIERIIKKGRGNAMVVSHGDPLMALVYHFIGFKPPRSHRFSMYPQYAAITIVSFKLGRPRLLVFNYSGMVYKQLLYA
ncbi:MAG: histidine phosphatase family protein [Candidatus Micrarchaeota archaeon]|nr:histidine phosphatase family protein [Candidatus Micrarchaeota archaeon]MDE1823818.1 histidine phosphatase family protein [Candidatus Micrarchaeota archaeon]MDE1849492.1 histidine phosphatase family protein [Candidatus Micrarchaeota archaeon]